MRNVLVGFFMIFLTVGFVSDGLCHPADEPEYIHPVEREAIREKVEILRIWELTRILDLDEETASRFFPMLHKYEQERAEIRQSIREDKRKLREAVEDESHRKVKRILKRLEKKQKVLQKVNEEEREELKDILTIEQQAKFILFQHKFARDVKKIVAEVKRRRFDMNR